MKKIVSFFGERSDVFDALNARARDYAAGLGFDYLWAPQTPFHEEEVVSLLGAADAGIIDIEPYGESIFRRICGSTRLLVRFGVGYDRVDLAAAARHGIAVARTTGANTMGVAEMALTLILAARRLLLRNYRCVEQGAWLKHVAHETVGGTVGIVGFGAIGQALAGLLRGLGCRILAYDPCPDRERMAQLGVEAMELEALFETADAVSLHVPLCPETLGMVDASLLARMKPTAVVVNTSRGSIVDEEALCHALASGRLAGAALDVFAREPLPADSPLLALDNLILTPHVSSQTEESLWRIYRMAIDITADFFAGRPCPHILNPDYCVRP